MKKYRFKPRFFLITITAGIIITLFALMEVDNVCSENIAEGKVIKPTYIEAEPALESLGEYKITHYCSCSLCCGQWAENRPVDEYGKEIVYTASGEIAEDGQTIAVDPDVIPLGSTVIINGQAYMAQDVGGAIEGKQIDIYCDSHDKAIKSGVYKTTVYKEM